MQKSNQILVDDYGRQYVQNFTQYDSNGNILSVGGRMMISSQNHHYSIKN